VPDVVISEERLTELLTLAVKRGLGDHPCRYLIDPRTVDHVVGMLTDIGDGDLRRGIEIVRTNHKWVCARVEMDEECAENHRLMTWVRGIVKGVGGKLATGFVWGCIILTAAGLILFFGGKAGPWIGFGK
jgi:hypothetical protein